MNNSRYRYIYLDVGNILFHDIAVDMVFSYLIFDKLNNKGRNNFFVVRENELKKGNINWIYDYCNKNKVFSLERVAEDAWGKVLENWLEINVPIHGAIDSVKNLSDVFSVTIAANQPIETIRLLDKYNITNYIDNVLLDSKLGVSKPNDLFFKKVLTITGNNPDESLYIGDRFDNDVLASQRNGFTPVWIQYQPVPIRSRFVPNWWMEVFYKSYLRVGPYNIWKYTDKYIDRKYSNVYLSLSNFEEELM